MYKFSSLLVIAILAFHLGGADIRAQVSIQANTTITEDFNSLGTSATANLPAGWRTDIDNTSVQKVNNYAGALTSTSYRAGNNFSATTYGIYNYGAGEEGTAIDRSLGWYADNSTAKSGNLYVHLRNTGATQINGLTISFDVEKYRKGTNNAGYTIQMYYSTNGTTWTKGGSVYRVSFDADADNNGYPSAPGMSKNVIQISLPASIPTGTDFYLAWNYSVSSTEATSNSQGLGVDNVIVRAESTGLNESYSWISGSTDFNAAGSWNPARTNPKSTDILVFNTSSKENVSISSLVSFGKIQIQNGATVNLTATSSVNAIIAGNAGGMTIDAGSKLNIKGTNPIVFNFSSNTISNIDGSVSFSDGPHRFLPQDVNTSTRINFLGNSSFTANSGFSGYPFGTKYAGTVVFKRNSKYISAAGSSPFGIEGSDEVAQFSRGSLFKMMQNATISFNNRSYSNIEIDFPGFSQVILGSNSKVDSLILTNSSNLTFSNFALSFEGNINVKSGNLNFSSCAIDFKGRDYQYVTNNGSLNFSGTTVKVNSQSSGGGIYMNSNLTINGNLELTKGNIKTSSNILEVTGYIINSSGYINGNLKIPAFSGSSSILFFPIGTDNGYSPAMVILNNVSNSGSLTAKAFETPHPNASNPNQCLKRYWDFDNQGITFNDASVQLAYLPADFNLEFTEAEHESIMQVGKYSSPTWQFPKVTQRLIGGTNDGGSITVSGITGFSSFTSTRNESALPVELTSFTHNVFDKRNVKLLWETSSEQNNSGFEIERTSVNKNEWLKIGFKEGRGTTNNITNYSFEDRNLSTGNYKYRLKQIDYNGNYTYFELSGEVIVSTPVKFDISQNYPNPFNPVSKVNFELPEDAFVSINVYDITGRNVLTVYNMFTKAGYHTAEINASSLSSGVYFYKFNTPNFSKVLRMVVVK